MRITIHDTLKNNKWVAYQGESGVVLGRDKNCDVQLPSRFVALRHSLIERGPTGWELHVLPEARAIQVNGKTIEPGHVLHLSDGCEFQIAQYVLSLDLDAEVVEELDPADEEINRLQHELHGLILQRLDLRKVRAATAQVTGETIGQVNDLIDNLFANEFRARIFETPRTFRNLLTLAFEVRLTKLAALEDSQGSSRQFEAEVANQALENLARECVQRVVRKLDLRLDKDGLSDDLQTIDRQTGEIVHAMAEQFLLNVKEYMVSQLLKKLLFDMIFGFGPLQDLLDMPNISEIMVVHPSLVYIERNGKVVRSNRTFVSDEALISIIERIVAPLGRRIDRSQPLVDARLPDGSRVNAIIPPLALKGPCLTIRRFSAKAITAAELIGWRALTQAAYSLLSACVRGRANMIVAGGTGSGKTTMLNVLSELIPEGERIVTIEDSAELQLRQEHVVTLETRPPTAEGVGEYTIRDLVKNALRMRPDRIIVGECRSGETIDMLQAMNTGHEGSMTTIHANSADDVASRLETLVLMGIDIPMVSVRKLIAQAIDIIVFVKRFSDGRRMVSQISEVVGVHPVTGEIEIRDIMQARGDGDAAVLHATGYIPSFLQRLADRGLFDPNEWFGEVAHE